MNEFFSALADLPPGSFWFGVSLLGVFVVVSFRGAWNQLRKSRTIRDAPTSKVRSAAQGQVELQGVTRVVGAQIESPLSRTPCAWWSYKLEVKKGDSGKKRWVTLESGTSVGRFALEDDTGRCLIEPAGAEVMQAPCKRWYGRRRDDAFSPDKSVWLFRKFRFTERYLWYDQPLYALGEFSSVAENDESQHRLGKPASAPFILAPGSQETVARGLRREAVKSYALFVVLGAMLVSLLAARLGGRDAATELVPAGWRLLDRSENNGRVREMYVTSAFAQVGSLRRLAFKEVYRRPRQVVDLDALPTNYRYFDCARRVVSAQWVSENLRHDYERETVAGRNRSGWTDFAQASQEYGAHLPGRPGLPTDVCDEAPVAPNVDSVTTITPPQPAMQNISIDDVPDEATIDRLCAAAKAGWQETEGLIKRYADRALTQSEYNQKIMENSARVRFRLDYSPQFRCAHAQLMGELDYIVGSGYPFSPSNAQAPPGIDRMEYCKEQIRRVIGQTAKEQPRC